jgi:hypothetical protein
MLNAKISDIYSVKNEILHLIKFMFTIIAVHYMYNILEISRKNSRKKDMVFKPSFKCSKNKNNNFIQAILKLETLLFQKTFTSFYHILYDIG